MRIVTKKAHLLSKPELLLRGSYFALTERTTLRDGAPATGFD